MIPYPHTYSAPVPAKETPSETAEQPEPVNGAPGLLAHHIRAARTERLRQEAQRPREPWYLRWPGVVLIVVVMFFGSLYMRQERPTPLQPAPITEGGYVIVTYDVAACFFTGSSNCRRLRAGQRMVASNRDSRGHIRVLYQAGDQVGWWVPVGAVQGVAAP